MLIDDVGYFLILFLKFLNIVSFIFILLATLFMLGSLIRKKNNQYHIKENKGINHIRITLRKGLLKLCIAIIIIAFLILIGIIPINDIIRYLSLLIFQISIYIIILYLYYYIYDF